MAPDTETGQTSNRKSRETNTDLTFLKFINTNQKLEDGGSDSSEILLAFWAKQGWRSECSWFPCCWLADRVYRIKFTDCTFNSKQSLVLLSPHPADRDAFYRSTLSSDTWDNRPGYPDDEDPLNASSDRWRMCKGLWEWNPAESWCEGLVFLKSLTCFCEEKYF